MALAVLRLYFAVDRLQHLASHKAEWGLLFLLLTQLAVFRGLDLPRGGGHWLARMDSLALLKLYILFFLGLKAFHWNRRWFILRLSPGALLVLTFAFTILVGWILLSLPRCTTRPVSLLDTLFTATSAVCVTGLTVVDTGRDFTLLGQGVILGLFQLGGLGLMTWAVCFMGISQQGLGFRERATMLDVLNTQSMGSIGKVARRIVLFTFLTEAGGAVLLYRFWPADHSRHDWWTAVFHAVSAFCNAGFSLFPDSLEGLSGRGVLFVFTVLIVIGGLGFPVLLEILSRRTWRRPQQRLLSRFSVHTKLVLTMTAALIVLAAAGIWLLELTFHERVLSWPDTLLTAVTPRTAGFNSVSIAGLSQPALLLIIFLMYVGASPAGTGGGIKTSTFAMQLGYIIMVLRGRERLEMMQRTIPRHMLQAATMIGVVATLFIWGSVFLLRCFQPEEHTLLELLFEEVSAFGTVGLSMGITAELNAASKLVIMASMFVGRIGPLTVIMALSQRGAGRRGQYPEARVIIG
ncbi:Trk family potassium uptake protein [bacterium]|nr:Trk family potassium uptake protein [bacterium]